MKFNGFIKIILSFCLVMATVFLFISPSSLFFKVQNFYFQKINPTAGIIHYEKQYKAQLEEANRIMNEANKIMDTISKINRVSITAEETQKFILSQKSKIDELFIKRETALNTVINIDNLGYEMSLPSLQKEFYKKRKVADENELKAFQVYRLSNTILIEGNNVYRNFWKYFYAITDLVAKEKDLNKLNKLITKKEEELSKYYTTEVEKAKEDKILTPAIFESMDQGYEVMQRLGSYYMAYVKDPTSQDTKDKETFLKQSFSQDVKKNDEIYQKWQDEFVAPGIYLQTKMHNISYDFWGQAYEYAKKQNMKGIFTVWNNNYPGYVNISKDKPLETLANSKEKRDTYYQIYEKPYIKYVRTALNTYMDGDSNNMIPKEAKEKKMDAEYTYGLDSFDKAYYKSKYVVLITDDYIQGGNLVTVVFQENPDRFFTAWIYEVTDKNFKMRGFWSKTIQNEEDIKRVNTDMKEFLMDKIHSL